jgi:hypothetical protein
MKTVKTIVINLIVLILSTPATALFAQTPEKTAPRFALTISTDKGGRDPLGRYTLEVVETNISYEVLREAQCAPLTFEVGIKVSIIYNGEPLQMDETKPAVQYIRNQDKEHMGHCQKSLMHEVKPGGGPDGAFDGIFDISLLYDMPKPGTYEITVSKETFPHNPEKSVTVKSNTLTIVVPEPEADAPK